METQQKPRVSYSQFVAQQKPEQRTVAWVLNRFVREMNAKPETWASAERRIFPYNDKSVGAKYTILKKRAGIKGLRLHDSRAKCYTSMREKGIPGAVAILVTGHETEALPERVYKRMKAEGFKLLQHQREQHA